MARRLRRLAAVLLVNALAVIAGCFAFEIAAVAMRPRWFSNVMVKTVPDGVDGSRIDRRTPMAVVRDLRSSGTRVYPLPSRPTVEQIFASARGSSSNAPRALAGVSHTETVFCAEVGPYTRYESDRFGFNNPDSVWNEPVDVALVGDSFVQGNCVDADSTIAAVMRRAGVRAVSLGVSGDGPLSDLATLREYALRAHPRTIVWAHYEGNDLCDLDEELRDSVLSRYLSAGDFTQRLAERQAEVDAELRAEYDRQLARLEGIYGDRAWAWRDIRHLSQLRALVADRFRRPERSAEGCSNLAALRRVLARARDDAAASRAELVFVYLPSSRLPDAPSHRRALENRAQVIDAARALGVRVVDLTDELRGGGDAERVWSFPMSHYTVYGYAQAANGIVRGLAALANGTGQR